MTLPLVLGDIKDTGSTVINLLDKYFNGKDAEFLELKMNADSPITELYLETKSYGALKALGVTTIGEFLSIDLDRINKIPGIGNGTRQRLEAIKQDILPFSENTNVTNQGLQSNHCLQKWEAILKQFTARTKNGLAKLSIETPEEFLALTHESFIGIRSMGETCWKEVYKFQKQLSKFYNSCDVSESNLVSNSRGVGINADSPITELYLEPESYEALKALGVTTIGEFLSTDFNHINNITGIGNGTRQRLDAIKQNVLPFFENTNVTSQGLQNNHCLPKWTTILDQFSARTKNGLAKLSIETPEDFLLLTYERFMNVRSMGKTSWKEVYEFQKQLSKFYNSCDVSESNLVSNSKEVGINADLELINKVREYLATREHIIDDLHIQSFTQLCKLRYDEVIALNHVGQETWKKLQIAIKKASSLISSNEYTECAKDFAVKDFPFFGGTGIGIKQIPIPNKFFPEVSTDILTLTSRNKSALENLRIATIGELLVTSPEQLLKQANFGVSSLEELRQSVCDYLDYRNNCSNESSIEMQDSFSDFIRYLCSLSNQSPKKSNILIARFCGDSYYPKNYEELGNEFGCTRERIRQIIKKTFENIKSHFESRVIVDHFQSLTFDILCNFRGVASLDEIGDAISKSLGWSHNISAGSLAEFYKCALSSNGITIYNNSISCSHPCRKCHFLHEHLTELLANESKGFISFETLTSDGYLCEPTPDRGCPVNKNLKFSKSFLCELFDQNSLNHDKHGVYSEIAWTMQHGGLNRKVTAILNMLGISASPETVCQEINRRHSEHFPPEKIHTALINDENVYSWGHGKFIHKNHIPAIDNILKTISDILSLKIKDTPFIALHGIFNEFRITFENAGIPNEYALSTIIAIYLKEFHVDRYRYIYEEKPKSATSIDRHIEQWVLDQGDEVKRSDLDDWMINKIGTKKSVTQFALNRLSDIIPTKRGYITHVDNLNINKEKLAPLHHWLENSLIHNKQIGVHKLYSEHEITCFQLGLYSKNMLYAVLRHFYSDKYVFSKYPHISLLGIEAETSLNKAVVNYIKEKRRVVSIDECVQFFEALGYSAVQLRARIPSIPELLPYYQGCIIHEEIIEWSKEKEEQLHKILVNAYKKRIQFGCFTGDLEDVFDLYENELPVLGRNMSWTGDLLASLSIRLEDVTMIGNAKRAYCITSDNSAILDLGDLMALVVKKHFKGGCSRSELNEWMVENGIARKQVTQRMFTAPKGLVMTEYECFWDGVYNDE